MSNEYWSELEQDLKRKIEQGDVISKFDLGSRYCAVDFFGENYRDEGRRLMDEVIKECGLDNLNSYALHTISAIYGGGYARKNGMPLPEDRKIAIQCLENILRKNELAQDILNMAQKELDIQRERLVAGI